MKWLLKKALQWILGRRPAAATDQGSPFRQVTFESAHTDRVPLSGWLLPCREARGVVLLCHGIHSTSRWMLPKARMLQRHGFASLSFDFRARGASGGEYCTMGQREQDDVVGAVNFLRGHPQLGSLPLAGLGESLGAASLLLAMARDPRIESAIVEACFPNLEAAVAQRMKWLLGPFTGSGMRSFRQICLEEFGVDTPSVAPAEHIASISPRPLLLIHDSLDVGCTLAMSDLLHSRAQQPVDWWVAPWTPHVCAAVTAAGEYERRVVGFLRGNS